MAAEDYRPGLGNLIDEGGVRVLGSRASSWDDSWREADIELTGVACERCAREMHRMIREMDVVKRLETSATPIRVTVHYDPAGQKIDALTAEIRKVIPLGRVARLMLHLRHGEGEATAEPPAEDEVSFGDETADAAADDLLDGEEGQAETATIDDRDVDPAAEPPAEDHGPDEEISFDADLEEEGDEAPEPAEPPAGSADGETADDEPAADAPERHDTEDRKDTT